MLKVQSGGFEAGNSAKISIDNIEVELEPNEDDHFRGLHLVAIDPADASVRFAQVFDTWLTSEELEAFISRNILSGYIICAACQDDCSRKLS